MRKSQRPEEIVMTISRLDSFLQTNFEITVEGFYEKENVQKEYFWTDIYRQRENDRIKFETFLREKGIPLLLITGQVGTGKTTFIQEKIESPRNINRGVPICNGIRIDLQKYSDEIREATQRAYSDYLKVGYPHYNEQECRRRIQSFVSELLNTIISEEIKEQFLTHFITLMKNDYPKDLLFTDVSNRPYAFNLNDIELPEKVDFYYKGLIDLASAIIISIPSQKHSSIYEKAMGRIHSTSKKCFDRYKQYEMVRNYLLENDEDVSDIVRINSELFDAKLVVYWLSAYSNFFNGQSILFLDNGDSILDATNHQDVLSTYTNVLAQSMSKRMYSDASPPKIVLALRDENVKMAHPAARRTRRPKTISLAYIPYGSKDEYDSSFLPLNIKNMGDIIIQRLEFCNKIIKINSLYKDIADIFDDFRFLMEHLWVNYFDDSEKRYKEWERFDLINICNGSIRVGLDMARFTTLGALKEIYLRGKKLDVIKSSTYKAGMKSRIINWFFKDVAGQKLKEYILKETRFVRDQTNLCCTHRVILTYLYNRLLKNNNSYGIKITCADLVKTINRLFNIKEDHIKSTLFFLYQPGDFYREFISIEQIQPLEASSDLSANALIYINQRGVVLISRIMQTVEYWSRLTGRSGGELSKSIYDLTTDHALNIFHTINEVVIELADIHIQNWYSLVLSPEGIPVSPGNRPFDWFKDDYTLGNNFYLERVINSHIFSLFKFLRYYLVERLREAGASGEDYKSIKELISILSEYQEGVGAKYVEQYSNQKKVAKFLRELLSRLKAEWDNYFIGSISSFIDKYLEAVDNLTEFKELKKMEILDKMGRDKQ